MSLFILYLVALSAGVSFVFQQHPAEKQSQRVRSALARISTGLATGSSGSSTGSNNVVGWRRATTSLPPTTLPSFNSPQSGYGCALMSSASLGQSVFQIKRLGRKRAGHSACARNDCLRNAKGGQRVVQKGDFGGCMPRTAPVVLHAVARGLLAWRALMIAESAHKADCKWDQGCACRQERSARVQAINKDQNAEADNGG